MRRRRCSLVVALSFLRGRRTRLAPIALSLLFACTTRTTCSLFPSVRLSTRGTLGLKAARFSFLPSFPPCLSVSLSLSTLCVYVSLVRVLSVGRTATGDGVFTPSLQPVGVGVRGFHKEGSRRHRERTGRSLSLSLLVPPSSGRTSALDVVRASVDSVGGNEERTLLRRRQCVRRPDWLRLDSQGLQFFPRSLVSTPFSSPPSFCPPSWSRRRRPAANEANTASPRGANGTEV